MPLPRYSLLTTLMGALILWCTGNANSAPPDEATTRALKEFAKRVQPVLTTHCLHCHGKETQEGNLRLDTLDPNLLQGEDADQWHEVLNKLNVGEMPPEDEEPLSDEDRETLTGWLTAELQRVAQVRRGTTGRIVMRRLNRQEYGNTLRDLLGVSVDFAKVLPPDGPSPDGFENNGQTLAISPLHLEYYAKIAKLALSKAIVDGPPESLRVRFNLQNGKVVSEPLAARDDLPQTPNPPNVRLEVKKGTVEHGGDHMILPAAKWARGTQIPARRGPEPHARMWLNRFPTEGDVRIRVVASAPKEKNRDGHPFLAVMIGNLLDDGIEYSIVDKVVEVRNESPQEYFFTGRLEDLPLPFRNKNLSKSGDLNRMLLGVWNAYNGTGDRNRFPRLKIHHIEFEAPYVASWPPASHTRIFHDSPNRGNRPIYAREVIERFMDRAFRRVPTRHEIDQVVNIWEQLWQETRPQEPPPAELAETVTPPKPGLRVDYYETPMPDATLSTFAAQKPVQSTTSADFRFDLPVIATRDCFALRYSGSINIERDGQYEFFIASDDGSRLFVDGRELIDNDGQHGMVEKSGRVRLKPGPHAITATYFNAQGGNGLRVQWKGPGIPKQNIPAELLTTTPGKPPVAAAQVPTFEETIRDSLVAVLVSPAFLYLTEPVLPQNGERRRLNDRELATRLSYFLWSSMPDDELRRLANTNRLHTPASLRQQVDRMLASDKSWEFVRNFSDQWLELGRLDGVAINKQVYNKLVVGLKRNMQSETHHFFAEVLHNDLSALRFIDSDFAVVNPVMASHYQLKDVNGYGYRRVSLDEDSHRGGILTHASVLTSNANGQDSHPIKRGSWLLRRLLNDPPPPPPPNVPELDPEDPDLNGLTLKKQLEVHRDNPACNSCHRKIDPWGVALEHYDALGMWREKPRNSKDAVDPQVTLPDGQQINGLTELKQYLLTNKKQQFARALTGKLLAYALGRSLDFTDDELVESLSTRFADRNYQLRELIVAIVTSDAFLTK